MSFRVRSAGEAKDRRRRHSYGDAVRDDGIGDFVARVAVSLVLAGDGVAHPMTQMHAGVAEADARKGGGEEHLRLGFVVVGVVDGAGEVFDCAFEGLQGENVGDGVCALVGGAVDGVRRAGGAGGVGDGCPGFKRVAEDVEAGGGVDGGGHGACIQGVADPQGGFEGAVCDACLCFFGDEVEDGGTGCFAAGTGGGGNGDEGGEGFRYREATAARLRYRSDGSSRQG